MTRWMYGPPDHHDVVDYCVDPGAARRGEEHDDGWHGTHTKHKWDESCDNPPKCREVVPQGSGKLEPDTPSAATSVAPAHDYDPPPSHYDGGSIDGWAIVDAFGLDFYLGNALKYIIRCGKKDIAPVLDDLIKARNYINKRIELEEKRDN